MLELSELRTVASGLDHPESVCWDPHREIVYAGGEAGQLYGCHIADERVELQRTIPGGSLLGIAVDGAGNLFVCDPGNHRVHRIDGASEALSSVGGEIAYPNYLAFDGKGSLWVSDSGAWGADNGALLRIDPGGDVQRVRTGLSFSNGIAVDDGHIYFVESGASSVSRIAVSGGEPEVVVSIPRTVPDGIAFDDEGGLWISCFQPNRVYRVDAAGSHELVLDDWSGEELLSPTNLAFAGPDLDVLTLASLCGQDLKRIDPGVRGRRLHYPGGDAVASAASLNPQHQHGW